MRLSIFMLVLLASCGSRTSEQNSSVPPTVTEQQKIIQETGTESLVIPQEQVLPKGYHTVSLYNNKLRLSVPDYFTEMSSKMKHSKYPRGNSPDVVYTDEDGTVNVAFKYTTTAIKSSDDLLKLSAEYAQQIQNKVKGFNSRIETVNGSEVVVFEFMSQAIDSRVYNLMFLIELDSRLLLGTFNCTEALKDEWQPKAKEMLLSIKK